MYAFSVNSHEQYAHRILAQLEAGDGVSQRSLSRDLGIALGLTNLLIRRLARKGWIRIVRVRPNRVRYLLTPAGLAEKARMTRRYLHGSVRFYAEARDRIRERLAALSAEWPASSGGSFPPEKRIVFFGGGEVAEIGFVCLQGTDLRLVAVVDDTVRAFFGVPVYERRQLSSTDVAGVPYDRVVVMSFVHLDRIRRQLDKRGLPAERIFWI